LRDRLVDVKTDNDSGCVWEELRAIARMARYTIIDDRSPDEILDYDGDGIPR
jgi:hypothetical protein